MCLRTQLTHNLHSHVTDVAVSAVDELRRNGWLNDALRQAKGSLYEAHLSGADLRGVDLSDALLLSADLSEAKLYATDLRRATLIQANLSGARLFGADLCEAYMIRANLSGANLSGADLTRADLRLATNLTEKQLVQAKSLENATMPDGTKYEEWIKIHELKLEENEPVMTLRQHVKDVSENKGIHPNKIYTMLRKEFNVSSYKEIENGQLEKAHQFLDEIGT